MIRSLLVLTLFASTLFAESLREKIAQMIVIGFNGTTVDEQLKSDIKDLKIGGVILFSKNIKSRSQLKKLTSSLKALDSKLIIAVDQEGGRVQRLRAKNGFKNFLSAAEVAKLLPYKAYRYFDQMAKELEEAGINLNLAPVVDLATNPKNGVIYKLQRSYGKDPKRVITYANLFTKAMHKHYILTTLKHFPGHGSSLKDSHKGFVDVTKTWSKKELEPFFKSNADLIMTAHIYNAHLDSEYPATLSKKTLSIIREKRPDTLIISDDMQMGAIQKNYDLNTTLIQSIDAGVDLLLFGNQLSHPIEAKALVDRIEKLVQAGKISKNSIDKAYKRIKKLKERLDEKR